MDDLESLRLESINKVVEVRGTDPANPFFGRPCRKRSNHMVQRSVESEDGSFERKCNGKNGTPVGHMDRSIVVYEQFIAIMTILLLLSIAILSGLHACYAFAPILIPQGALFASPSSCLHSSSSFVLCSKRSSGSEDADDDDQANNPYADPNYPDLEFVNYDDPDYQAFADEGDDYFPSSSETNVDAEIEAMREDRRRRNDEYQFQTYFAEILKRGAEYKGEWTVYQTSTFLNDVPDEENGYPRLVKAARPIRVVSKGYKIGVETDSVYPVDAERICHAEVAVTPSGTSNNPLSDELHAFEKQVVSRKYWPEQLSALDFRGDCGNMCVGNAYTICTAIPLKDAEHAETTNHLGPFSEYRAEVGLEFEEKRFRVKFDYSVLTNSEQEQAKIVADLIPPLYLKSMTVCREALNDWPIGIDNIKDIRKSSNREADHALFGVAGAQGGIFDPPPIIDEEQASRYMLVDLDGRATVLFPFRMDQDDGAFGGQGWVKTLDWTPGNVRYQVDRKVTGGSKLLGLRTLELSSIRPEDVDDYRPRDGGQDMRQ
ncbi:hypothetical protein MPSEU_000833200 [Mayamaea pseudoterrestris]|nr:hypothetical protein MPSEU_000833200 [Mayamaea pseudoterrestris]